MKAKSAMLDRLTSMAVFVKAAEVRSFTEAGVALGLTSQMVGEHVAALEERPGTPLLRRTTRRQSLTETGARFYERCRLILAEAETAYALEEVAAAEPQGRLRLSAPVGFGACWLAPILTTFLNRHPLITTELTLTDISIPTASVSTTNSKLDEELRSAEGGHGGRGAGRRCHLFRSGSLRSDWTGKVVVDLTNAASVPTGGKRVVFVSSDHADASSTIAALIPDLDFAPIEVGKINEGGRLIQARNALVFQNLVKMST